MLQKLNYRNKKLRINIQGCFADGRDAMYYISDDEYWHVTFVKVDEGVEEWLRKIVLMPGTDELFISEVEFKYRSEYKTIGGARGFVKKQPDYNNYKHIIYKCLTEATVFGGYYNPTSPSRGDDVPF